MGEIAERIRKKIAKKKRQKGLGAADVVLQPGDAVSQFMPYALLGLGIWYFSKNKDKIKGKLFYDQMQNEIASGGFSPKASAEVFRWQLIDGNLGFSFNVEESELYKEAEKIKATGDSEGTWKKVRNEYFALTGRELEKDLKWMDKDDYSWKEGELTKFYQKAGLTPR